MRFTMIKYDGETVTLSRVEQGANEADAIERTSTNEPNPEFKRALTAFRRHVLDCAPFLADVRDQIDVHTVHLKTEKKTGRRTLQVACSIALEACSDKPISITTPYMTEPVDDAGDPSGFLEKGTLKMMDTLEECATAFHKGDHKGQVELLDSIEATVDHANGNGNGKHAKKARGGQPTRIDAVLSKRDRDEVGV